MMTEVPEPGDRIELVSTNDPYTKLKPGDRGFVERVSRHPSGAFVVEARWDSGSRLMLLSEVDVWRIVPRLKAVD